MLLSCRTDVITTEFRSDPDLNLIPGGSSCCREPGPQDDQKKRVFPLMVEQIEVLRNWMIQSSRFSDEDEDGEVQQQVEDEGEKAALEFKTINLNPSAQFLP